MTISNAARLFAGVTLVAAMASAGAASAQAQAPAGAARAAPAPFGGPVIPGMCILDNNRLIGQSAIGKHVIARMQQLRQQVDAELNPIATSLTTERQTLATAKVAGNDPRAVAWETKAANYQRTQQIREQELIATRNKALIRIGTEADPVMRQVYTQKNCGMLMEGGSVYGANPAMDITPQVIAGLNAKITTFAFERERAQQPAAAPAARQ